MSQIKRDFTNSGKETLSIYLFETFNLVGIFVAFSCLTFFDSAHDISTFFDILQSNIDFQGQCNFGKSSLKACFAQGPLIRGITNRETAVLPNWSCF